MKKKRRRTGKKSGTRRANRNGKWEREESKGREREAGKIRKEQEEKRLADEKERKRKEGDRLKKEQEEKIPTSSQVPRKENLPLLVQ